MTLTPDNFYKRLMNKLKKIFCSHDFNEEPYYQSPHFSDIVYHKCKKCSWIGYKDSVPLRVKNK